MTWLSVVWTAAEAPRAAADRLLVIEVAARTGHAVRVARLCPGCGSSAHGRPVLVPDRPGRPGRALPAVSLSRGGGLTVVAVADTVGLGVDVEAVAAFTDQGVVRVLGEPADDLEAASSRRGAAGDSAALATTWVRTEAALKAAGTGLAVDPATVRLTAPDRAPAIVAWPAGVAGPGWLLDLDLGSDLRAAVAGGGQTPADVSVRQAGQAAARG